MSAEHVRLPDVMFGSGTGCRLDFLKLQFAGRRRNMLKQHLTKKTGFL
jgi:hypothetical protein